MKKIIFFSLLVIITSMVSCQKYSEKVAPLKDVILDMNIDLANLPSDGESVSTIKVQIPVNAESNLSTVKFKTDLGIFIPEGKNEVDRIAEIVNVNGEDKRFATIKIKNDNVLLGTANVTAEIVGYKTTQQINFINAYPNKVKLSADQLSIIPSFSNEVKFFTVVSRIKGIPTKDNIIDVEARDSLKRNIGYFRNYENLSNTDGKNTFTFTLGNSSYYGKIIIRAKANDGQKNILDSLIIFSTKN
jgi:hypothetical protein